MQTKPLFRNKTLAALLAFVGGTMGLHHHYLGRRYWYAPALLSLPMMAVLWNAKGWHQTPAFFLLMVPAIAGYIESIVIALTPDARFDERFNATASQKNDSGWSVILVALGVFMVSSVVTIATIALFFQSWFEHIRDRPTASSTMNTPAQARQNLL